MARRARCPDAEVRGAHGAARAPRLGDAVRAASAPCPPVNPSKMCLGRAARPGYPVLLSNIVFLKQDGAASWCSLAYFLPGQSARTTPRRVRNRGADSGATSGRPIFCHAFVKVDDSAVFADSAAPSKRPIFATRSRRSTTPPTPQNLIASWPPIRWRFRSALFFVGPVKTRPRVCSCLATPPILPTPQQRPSALFFATHSCRSTTPTTPQTPERCQGVLFFARHS